MLLPIHIAAGGLAIVLGAVALSVKKGGTLHRRSGLLGHLQGSVAAAVIAHSDIPVMVFPERSSAERDSDLPSWSAAAPRR